MVGVIGIRRSNGTRRTAPVLVMGAQGSQLLHEDVSVDAILTLDPDGYILSSSTGATRAGHFHIEDIVGRHVSCLYPPQEDGLTHGLAAAARHGTYTESGWRVRADGSRFWAETVITATRDTDTHLAGFSVAVRDMSAHSQHLRVLHAVGEVNRSILEGGADDEVLTLIARRVREAVGAEVVRVLALGWGDVLTVRAVDGAEASTSRSPPTPEESALAYEVIRAGQPRVFSDTGRTPPEHRLALREVGLMSVLDVPLAVHGHTVGVIEAATRRGGHRFTTDDLQTVGLFTGAAGVAVGQAQVHESLCRLDRIAPVGQDSLEQTLNALAIDVVARTGSLSCTIYLLEPGQTLRLAGRHSRTAPSPGPLDSSRTSPVATAMEAIASAAPVVQDCDRGFAERGRDSYPKRRLRRAKWGAALGVPLLRQGEAIGAVCCCYPPGQRPGDSDIGILRAIADEAASAVEKARLWAAAQEKASREERERLSRELHDTVSQALYSIALGARTAHELLDRDVTKVAEPIDYIHQLADAGLAEMRALLFELRPDSLETEGLVAALAKHVDALRARYGIAAEAMLGAEPEATPEAKHALYRIAQESLHNVVKHSGARHVLLRLLNGPGTVTLVVTDDGVGFDSHGSFPGHLGLRSMHERAREVGGTLKVDSQPGQGSRVRATVPARP